MFQYINYKLYHQRLVYDYFSILVKYSLKQDMYFYLITSFHLKLITKLLRGWLIRSKKFRNIIQHKPTKKKHSQIVLFVYWFIARFKPTDTIIMYIY